MCYFWEMVEFTKLLSSPFLSSCSWSETKPQSPWKSMKKMYVLTVRNISPCGCLWCRWLQRAAVVAVLGAVTNMAQLRHSRERRRGALTRLKLLKAPHHLCAGGTLISLEQSFKDSTQFSCLPPAINRVAESFVLLDCAPSPLQTTVLTGFEWSVFELPACAGGWELDAVSISAAQLTCQHNKQKCFQRYGVGEITALFQRESFLGALCSQSDHANLHLLNAGHLSHMWTLLVWWRSVLMSQETAESNCCSFGSLHWCINYGGEEGLIGDQTRITLGSDLLAP